MFDEIKLILNSNYLRNTGGGGAAGGAGSYGDNHWKPKRKMVFNFS